MRTKLLQAALMLTLAAACCAVAVAQPGTGSYGPCCPLVKGQSRPTATVSGGHTVLTGPRYVCQTKPVSLAYNDSTHAVDMVEVMGTLLAPARLFTMTGADLEWGGQRHFALARGDRRVELTLGSHAVTMTNGSDTQMVSWPLCPRLLNGISYAPLRPLAEALGLTVAFKDGVVTLSETAPTHGAATTAQPPTALAQCPADRVEEALGVTVVRSPAECAFGVGAGIEAVNEGGLAAKLGLQAKDVIIAANGKPVHCPKDLDQLFAGLKASNRALQSLVVARGSQKITLSAQPVGQ